MARLYLRQHALWWGLACLIFAFVAFRVGMMSLDPVRASELRPDGPSEVLVSERSISGFDARVFEPKPRPEDGERAHSKRPLVLYIPAWGGERGENDILLEDIASWGFIVVATDDISHDRPVPGATAENEAARLANFQLASAADLAAFNDLGSRRTNLSAVKEQVLIDAFVSGETGLAINSGAIGVVGYSHGGAAAGALLVKDRRVRAAVNLDGWVRGTALAGGVDRPLLGLFAEMNRTQGPEWMWPQRYWAIRFFEEEVLVLHRLEQQSHAEIRILTGVTHADFADHRVLQSRWLLWRPWRMTVRSNADIRTALNGLVIPFLQRNVGTVSRAFVPGQFAKRAVLRLSEAYGEDTVPPMMQ